MTCRAQCIGQSICIGLNEVRNEQCQKVTTSEVLHLYRCSTHTHEQHTTSLKTPTAEFTVLYCLFHFVLISFLVAFSSLLFLVFFLLLNFHLKFLFLVWPAIFKKLATTLRLYAVKPIVDHNQMRCFPNTYRELVDTA